jgi:hypothetical protein
MKDIQWKIVVWFSGCLLAICTFTSAVQAQTCATNPDLQACSSNQYGVSQVFFGSGGELQACSGTYCAKQSAGELTVGNTKSTSYQAKTGFNVNREESLELTVANTSVNLGIQSVAATAKGTAKFTVKSYLSSGYSVQTVGTPPSTSSRTLTAMTTMGPAVTGTEQFGINLVANTGFAGSANPAQLPDSTFSFGAAATGYNTTDRYKYVNGDIIAASASSSGTTEYTISYITNISNVTGSGVYSMQQSLVATATF